MILSVYVDDDTAKRLELYAREHGCTIVGLAENAVAEAASVAFRYRNDDPAGERLGAVRPANNEQMGFK